MALPINLNAIMNPFKVHILGCGSARPTPRHCLSAQIVNYNNCLYAIDCGEGMQAQLARHHLMTGKLDRIFISHLHGDHCFGLIGMISTFGMLGRTAALHIYAYKDLNDILQRQIEYFCNGLEYDIVFHAIDPTKHAVVYEDKSVSVETVPLVHRVPCCGFIFREKPTLPHIRRDMIDCYEVPLSQINNIKNGADWTTPDGLLIPNSRLTVPADCPRSYAYCSDTKYSPALAEAVRGVDLLYHEATYDSSNEARAKLYHHSTAAQAATVARDAGARRLVIGHFSARYDEERTLLAEAKAIFPDTVLANEGEVFDV